MKYFKVKIGYRADDFISIESTELPKALKALVIGGAGVVIFKEGVVMGNHIMAIVPDYNRELGFNRDYVMTGEDYKQLGESKIDQYRMLMDEARSSLEPNVKRMLN